MAHDYVNYPELSNAQLQEFGFTSPHVQITEDFEAEVIKVKDGDTVTLRVSFRDFDFPLRLLDINSPEMSEGGDKTKQWLKEQIEGQKVYIEIDYENRVGKYGRLLGRILYRGLDIGDQQLNLGLAVPFGQDSPGIPNLQKEINIDRVFKV